LSAFDAIHKVLKFNTLNNKIIKFFVKNLDISKNGDTFGDTKKWGHFWGHFLR